MFCECTIFVITEGAHLGEAWVGYMLELLLGPHFGEFVRTYVPIACGLLQPHRAWGCCCAADVGLSISRASVCSNLLCREPVQGNSWAHSDAQDGIAAAPAEATY
jgi:hypothetical protein